MSWYNFKMVGNPVTIVVKSTFQIYLLHCYSQGHCSQSAFFSIWTFFLGVCMSRKIKLFLATIVSTALVLPSVFRNSNCKKHLFSMWPFESWRMKVCLTKGNYQLCRSPENTCQDGQHRMFLILVLSMCVCCRVINSDHSSILGYMKPRCWTVTESTVQ